MKPELEHFLRQATKGLRGQEREIVWDEIRSNLELLSIEYQAHQESPDIALTRAMREFGNPQNISAGMTRVYNPPKILRRTVLLLMLFVLFVAPSQMPRAQLTSLHVHD
jgi:hypothetical protein